MVLQQSLFRKLFVTLSLLCAATAAHAATLTWNGGNGGIWDTGSTPNWLGATTTWTAGDIGIFAGTSGTVTISGAVSANVVTFNTPGYLLTSGTLNLINSGAAINVNENATIDSVLTLNAGDNGFTQFLGNKTLTVNGLTTANVSVGSIRYIPINLSTGTVNFLGGVNATYTITTASQSRTSFFTGVGTVNIEDLTSTDVGSTMLLTAYNPSFATVGTTTISGTSTFGPGATASNQLRSYAGNTTLITGVKTGTSRMNFNPIGGGQIVLDLEGGNDRWGNATVTELTDLNLRGGTVEVLGAVSGTRSQNFGSISTAQRGSSTLLVTPRSGTTLVVLTGSFSTGTLGSTLIDISAPDAIARVRTGTNGRLLGNVAGGQTATSGVSQYVLLKDSTAIGYATHTGAGSDIVRYTGAASYEATSNDGNTNYVVSGTSLTLSNASTVRTLQIDTSNSGTLNLGGNTLTSNSVLITGSNDYTISNGGMAGVQDTTAVVYHYGTGLLTYSGTLLNTTALTKTGPGTLNFTGNNGTGSGNITIAGGALRTPLTGGALTANNVLVFAGGVLESSGTFVRSGTSVPGGYTFGVNDGQAVGGGFAAAGGDLVVRLNNGIAAVTWQGTGNLAPTHIGAAGTPLLLNSTTADSMVDFQNNINLAGNGLTRVIDVADNPNLTTDFARISGTISGAAGANGSNAFVKQGAGLLQLTGNNTFVGITYVKEGTLSLASSGTALGGTSSVTVNAGGTLLLGANNQINNAASLTLAGGTFNTGGFSEGSDSADGIGALTLTAASTLNFGSGASVITFAGFVPGGNVLTILNWTEGSDQLIFSENQFGNLAFFSFNGMGAAQNDLGGGFYEIVPVPEPTTIICGIILAGIVLWRDQKYFRRLFRGHRRRSEGAAAGEEKAAERDIPTAA